MNLREKLELALGPVYFSDLKPHADRGALWVVAQELALIDVAHAIAEDKAPMVETWLRSSLLVKATPVQISEWEKRSGQDWEAVVVAPYVLVREVTTSRTSD